MNTENEQNLLLLNATASENSILSTDKARDAHHILPEKQDPSQPVHGTVYALQIILGSALKESFNDNKSIKAPPDNLIKKK